MSIAVLLSGTGTNFEALHNEQIRLQQSGARSYGRIDVVFTNVPKCAGAQKARERNIQVVSLNSRSYFHYIGKDPGDRDYRKFYDAAALSLIDHVCNPDLIVLAGYRRKLSTIFFNRFPDSIINMYPGDITKDYPEKGTPAYVSAGNAGETELRCSTYFEREDERFGRLIARSGPVEVAELLKLPRMDAEKVIRQKAEWVVLPFVVHELIAKGRVSVDDLDNVYIDGVNTSDKGYDIS